MAESKIFTRDFFIVSFARMGSSMVFATMTATIASYAFSEYNVDSGLAGVAVGMFILMAMISRVVSSRYMEVIGRRRMMIVSGSIFFVLTALYLIKLPFVLFVILRGVHGFIFGSLSNVLNTIAISAVPRDRLAEGMGWVSLTATLASALGPLVGIWLFQNFSFFILFVACTAYSLIGLVLSLFLYVEPVILTEEQREELRGTFRLRDCLEIKAIPMCLLVTICDIFYFSVSAFLPTYAGEIGLAEMCSLYFLVYSASLIVSRPLTGKIMDKRGEDTVMYPSFLMCLLGYLCLAFCSGAWMLLLSSVLMAAGRGTLFGIVQTMAVRSVPAHRMGVATGTFFLFADGGAGLGPMIMGAVMPLLGGYANMYGFEAVMMVVLCAYYFILTRKLNMRP